MAEISETASKKRSGRPRLNDEWLRIQAPIWPEITTRRGLQDKSFALRAWKVLQTVPSEDFRWLLDKAAGHANKARAIKWSVLAQLGRIGDDVILLELARQICTIKSSVKEAVAIIRRYRTGKSGEGEASKLMAEIVHAIDVYRERYPKTTKDQVMSALHMAETVWSASSEIE